MTAKLLVAAGLIGFVNIALHGVALAGALPEPTWQVRDAGAIDREDRAELSVTVHRMGDGQPLAVRAIVTAAGGEHVDGSGYGLYADGRFFAEGEFRVKLPPGRTRIELHSGPEHVPAEFTVNATAGRHRHVEVNLPRWFSPRDRGWYAADNHVHAQHDAVAAAVRTSLAYTALQARANGLSYVTEAGSHVDYSSIETLNRREFVIHRADELRPGAFVGHFNTPGIDRPIEHDLYKRWQREPLPGQQIREEVHRRGGALIHTHPMSPPHQLHWMGASPLYSDAVMGRPADAMDIDARHTELLWFSALNLGNRIAATASTDAALGRAHTRSPGDRRVYCQLDELAPAALAAAIRAGRTFATSGGPVFVFLDIEGHRPGDTVRMDRAESRSVEVEVQSLHPLRSVHLYYRGRRVAVLDAAGERGPTRRRTPIDVPVDKAGWLVARAEDVHGDWAITSPVYFEPAQASAPPPREALLLAIANHTRFIELRREFFAHLIVTVCSEQSLAEVALIRDGEVMRRFTPEMGDRRHGGRTPVSELHGEYGPGWLWHPGCAPVHFQADWPVTETGWYALRAVTAAERVLVSDAVRFDAETPNSHQLSVAHLRGGETALTRHGYGEEMPLDEIELPFEGDHWWYPRNTYFRLEAQFGSQIDHRQGGRSAAASFRRHDLSP
jgi:hypothetical protein